MPCFLLVGLCGHWNGLKWPRCNFQKCVLRWPERCRKWLKMAPLIIIVYCLFELLTYLLISLSTYLLTYFTCFVCFRSMAAHSSWLALVDFKLNFGVQLLSNMRVSGYVFCVFGTSDNCFWTLTWKVKGSYKITFVSLYVSLSCDVWQSVCLSVTQFSR